MLSTPSLTSSSAAGRACCTSGRPDGARVYTRRFSSSVCGAWSVPITSIRSRARALRRASRGDALAAHRAGREQRQLAHRGQVQHMQARAEAPGQMHGQARGAVAGVGIADQRVRGRRDEFAVARPPPPLVLHNAGRVLAMGQDDGALGIDLQCRPGVVEAAGDPFYAPMAHQQVGFEFTPLVDQPRIAHQ
ncbi:hypothetical protein WR25_05241 [Diploscapter pachys]|uniref:Uncharacterized protein n=1 Tax=Diploscapter pachys TaxID=2018661 RepID=A0A2A2K9Q8_9BILA|nr:hypothetical protein WR25_05241 [Diploscapter pachys]